MKKLFSKSKRTKLRFSNLKIGSKYAFILSIVLALFIISAVVVGFLLQNIQTEIESMDRRGDRAVDVTEMGSLIRAKSIRVYQYMVDPSTEVEEEYTTRSELLDTLKEELRPRMNTDTEKALFEQMETLDDELNRKFNEVIGYMRQGEEEIATRTAEEANAIQLEAVQHLNQLTTIVNEDKALAARNAKNSQMIALTSLLIGIAISIVISIVLITVINRMVSRNLNKVVAVSNQISDGDLQVEEIHYLGKDEIGQLASSMNTMSANLRQIIERISNVSDTVSAQSDGLSKSANEVKSGTEQIATTMQELASGTETQANHAGDVASKMSDFSQKVKEANENGEKIEGASTNVLDMTQDGREMMSSSVTQMNRVNTIVKEAVEKVRGLDGQTKEVSKLVAVIKDIAEQTNLLALNAAIESARAGEHGKGFAVVADEVRKLAEQVANSVTDITGIVATIQNESSDVSQSLEEGYGEVEEGTTQIEKTGETFEQINHAVNDMVVSIRTVTGNLSEMTASSEEINGSVEEIASISEESAAGVEQTSSSAQQASSSMEEVSTNSDELAKLAEELNGLVSQFKL
ncbi:methyl-accepting chemotaxis protein [Gracilibacillus kekensis]|uniref:Methyl-accepting chemotaxis protein n=1 Tax=Gracilibacillus kekensis TaxID=1027249 RepID=A0A1M7N2T7_9BACI|nr:HAMP domain-containing methyl-accepting chemotaxis protein [Gracilibacillus kekensis]SHM97266.1 methyl-accepting chemotaxis protein [Gracilibacillus kekensis]